MQIAIARGKAAYLGMALMTIPVWTLGGLILGCIMSFGLTSNGSWTLFWIGAALPLLSVLLLTKYMRSKSESMSKALVAEIVTPDTDYYHHSNLSAIAVDVGRRMVTVHTVPSGGSTKKKQRTQFSIDKVRNFEAYAPGHTTYESPGRDVMYQSEAMLKSAVNVAAALQETGLRLDLDDVMNPEVFVQMDFASARRWFLILEKLADGTLEKQREALHFQ